MKPCAVFATIPAGRRNILGLFDREFALNLGVLGFRNQSIVRIDEGPDLLHGGIAGLISWSSSLGKCFCAREKIVFALLRWRCLLEERSIHQREGNVVHKFN